MFFKPLNFSFMSLGCNRTKNRKKKNQENSDSNPSVVVNQTVRPFNFGGSGKLSQNRAKGGLAGTGGAVFT